MVLPTQTATTMVTMNDTAMLDRSIDAVRRLLTEERRGEGICHVINHNLKPHKQDHREGVEVLGKR